MEFGGRRRSPPENRLGAVKILFNDLFCLGNGLVDVALLLDGLGDARLDTSGHVDLLDVARHRSTMDVNALAEAKRPNAPNQSEKKPSF